MDNETHIELEVPSEVTFVTETLEKSGYEAYLIGGCVRDLFLKKAPKDWDITTNATPDEIIELFPETFYENKFGTVGVVNKETENDTLKIIEVTPYRTESTYSDNRRPDEVNFSDNLNDDLKRRDFAMNAVAYSPSKKIVIDNYGGIKDIHDGVIRTVGEPKDRFNEDALRILRAIRLACQLGFTINVKTQDAIKETAGTLKKISKERIRDEFTKIVSSEQPMSGLVLSHELSVLQYVLPDLERGIGITQNGDHIYSVWEHNLRALQHAANKGYSFHVKLSALLHDISKPETRRWSKDKENYTFYSHEVAGAYLTKKILHDLKFPRKTVEDVTKLVRNHMFFSDIDKITLTAVRRIITKVGTELIWELIKLRTCDRIGMGRPKEEPYRLRKYEVMIEEALRSPISVGMLKIDGTRIMEVTHETPGPKLGYILHSLLEEVLDDPNKNTEKYLEDSAITLNKLPLEELKARDLSGKGKKQKEEEVELKEIRKKYKVD